MNDVKNISAKELDEILKESIVLLDIWAPWCGWCRRLSPIIDEVAKEVSGKATVIKMNLEDNEEIKEKLDFMTIPALFFFKNGKVIKQTGSIPKEEIIDTLKSMLTS